MTNFHTFFPRGAHLYILSRRYEKKRRKVFFIYSTALIFCIFFSGLNASAQETDTNIASESSDTKTIAAPPETSAEANQLFSKAVNSYVESRTAKEERKWVLLREVRDLLEQIVEEHPNSVPGRRIASDAPLGSIDKEALLTELANAPPLWFERVVPGGKLVGSYRHGQFPTNEQRTFAGVDIGGDCGLEVVSPEEGTVAHILGPDDPIFSILGHTVAVLHHAKGGRITKTVFSNLARSPDLEVDQKIEIGSKIGEIGKGVSPDVCSVHFEVQHFTGLIHPDWNAPTGLGDWSKDEVFKTAWSAPDKWLSRDGEISFDFSFENNNGPEPVSVPAPILLKVAIGQKVAECWKGDLPFARTTIRVRFWVNQSSRPEADFRLLDIDPAHAEKDRMLETFYAARIAILQCGADGFGVPIGQISDDNKLKIDLIFYSDIGGRIW
jgi:murein DD-endopeptidase MepM/ murein hydrolase activator NlpD